MARSGDETVGDAAQTLVKGTLAHPTDRGPNDRRARDFTRTDKFDRPTLAKIADEARGTFDGMPGLRFKSFTLDDAGELKNFYLWDDEEKARAFFKEEIVDMVTGIYGVPPKIEYFDVLELADNSRT